MSSDARLKFATAALGALAVLRHRARLGVHAAIATSSVASRPGCCRGRLVARRRRAASAARAISRRCSAVATTARRRPSRRAGPTRVAASTSASTPARAAELSKGSTGCSFWTLPADDAVVGARRVLRRDDRQHVGSPRDLQAPSSVAKPLDSRRVRLHGRLATDTNPVYTPLTGTDPHRARSPSIFLSQAEEFDRDEESRRAARPAPSLALSGRSGASRDRQVTRLPSSRPTRPSRRTRSSRTAAPTSSTRRRRCCLPVSSWDKSYVAVDGGPLRADRRPRHARSSARSRSSRTRTAPRSRCARTRRILQGDGVDADARRASP